jgi:bifunctional non-homologous end joining protein LigD
MRARAGKVDHGFDNVSVADPQKRLRPLSAPALQAHRPQGYLVEPKLSAEIEYRAKSAGGTIRYPFFRDLRRDL